MKICAFVFCERKRHFGVCDVTRWSRGRGRTPYGKFEANPCIGSDRQRRGVESGFVDVSLRRSDSPFPREEYAPFGGSSAPSGPSAEADSPPPPLPPGAGTMNWIFLGSYVGYLNSPERGKSAGGAAGGAQGGVVRTAQEEEEEEGAARNTTITFI